jgi:hypothetical protein
MAQLWFNENSYNYLPEVDTLPSGAKQTPGFMGRETAYHMRFLNVDTRLSFVENILFFTHEGAYERHGARGVQPPSLGRDIQSFGTATNAMRPALPEQYLTLPQTMDVPAFAAMLEAYAFINLDAMGMREQLGLQKRQR